MGHRDSNVIDNCLNRNFDVQGKVLVASVECKSGKRLVLEGE